MKFTHFAASILFTSSLALAQSPAPVKPTTPPAPTTPAATAAADAADEAELNALADEFFKRLMGRVNATLQKGVVVKIKGAAGEGTATLKAPEGHTWDL